MSFDNSAIYDMNDGLPIDKSYLECGLPKYLQESLDKMIQTWKIIDSGKKYLRFDVDYCTLQSNINTAEMSSLISSEQAWYLRETYLRIERGAV